VPVLGICIASEQDFAASANPAISTTLGKLEQGAAAQRKPVAILALWID